MKKYMVKRCGLAFGKIVRVTAIYWWLQFYKQTLMTEFSLLAVNAAHLISQCNVDYFKKILVESLFPELGTN